MTGPVDESAERGSSLLLLALAASVALHVTLYAGLVRLPARPVEGRGAPVSLEIVETPPPPAVMEQAPPRPPALRASPAPPAVRAPAAPRAQPERARDADAPPPPHSAPATAKPGEVRIGVSMSSTTAAGTYAAPAGNSAMGQAPRAAPDPGQVRPYRSDRYAAPGEVSSLPVPIRVDLPKSEYPPDALRDGFEGTVKLRLVVDEEGLVREATVVSDPGRGLGAAAARAAKRWFRFRPARKDGVAVATEIPFTVEFQLQ